MSDLDRPSPESSPATPAAANETKVSSSILSGHPQAKLVARRIVAEGCYRSGLIRLLQRYGRQPWRILTYHRVVDPELEPLPVQPGMYVRPETFDRQMEYLATQCHVIPLEELISAIEQRTPIHEGTVVITFDDGWRDTYVNAFPVLHDFKLPATVFLATAFVGSADLFWTDRVAHSVQTLRRAAVYRDRVMSLIQEARNVLAEHRDAVTTIIGRSSDDEVTGRTDDLIEHLKLAPPAARKPLVDTLTALTKEFSTSRLDRMFLSWPEVTEMSQDRITFGSHSHNHFQMTELNAAQLRDEVVNSYQQLHEHRLTPSGTFCYPGGYLNAETQQALRERGVRYAASVDNRSDFQANPALLGRINIHEDVTSCIASFAFRLWASRT